MSKNTSITLGPHFERFINKQLKTGRFSSTSEVIRAALRLLEEEETKLSTLRKLLEEGEQSGISNYTLTGLIDELNNDVH
ncbi:type II toxin-antitoxin system ParD family antitoxin [Thiohalobacter sp. IOR34]|uniref:type II toxin-antitoxin system ParD family antitoxin n=1 Tax=Thiohalobacter sp. IOR34 TaxID=3057176 RepID=UPI0025B12E7B|nr:type II toxin-antitoxin system ParD family antitoxin [Thiohalobacter sp. IOR34]WJW76079.1 type II toxin-antitoxin system ParD family antitoxin [Thiohalobacter sp. IOR34]